MGEANHLSSGYLATGYLAVGKIVGSHGIKGDLKIYSNSGDPSDFPPGMGLLARFNDGRKASYTIQWCKPHSRHFILALDGVDDRDQAEALKGCELLVQRADLPALEEDSYFYDDIIGLKVMTVDREPLGVVKSIMSAGGNDVYVVVDPETRRETLLPAIKSVISDIDLETGIIQVVLPEMI